MNKQAKVKAPIDFVSEVILLRAVLEGLLDGHRRVGDPETVVTRHIRRCFEIARKVETRLEVAYPVAPTWEDNGPGAA